MSPTRRPTRQPELTEAQRSYFLSWVRGMALGLPSETIYTAEHPFAGHTDDEVAAVWRHHRAELLQDYDDPHGRAPWPDRAFHHPNDEEDEDGDR